MSGNLGYLQYARKSRSSVTSFVSDSLVIREDVHRWSGVCGISGNDNNPKTPEPDVGSDFANYDR